MDVTEAVQTWLNQEQPNYGWVFTIHEAVPSGIGFRSSEYSDLSKRPLLEIIPCTAVPTVSEWGLIVMTLLVLTAGTLVYARRRPIHA